MKGIKKITFVHCTVLHIFRQVLFWAGNTVTCISNDDQSSHRLLLSLHSIIALPVNLPYRFLVLGAECLSSLKSIETHARAFLTLTILAIGTVNKALVLLTLV